MSRLAKHVLDAGWAQFFTILASKAECAGRELVRVDPRGTSQECSGCGKVVRKTLAERVDAARRAGWCWIAIRTQLAYRKTAGARPSGKGRPEEPRSPCLAIAQAGELAPR